MSNALQNKRPYGTLAKLWESVLYPVLSTVKPKQIVEIGSDLGHNTENLLSFCFEHGGELQVIDPVPRFNADNLRKKYGDRLCIHKKRSVDVLHELEEYDLVVIDGDHNWYTVHTELLLIEEYAKKRGSFPMVILHDTEWPYGRRDMYHVPESIPKEYCKPYAKKGLLPQEQELQENVGMNKTMINATSEGGEKSGVRTAVEDFLTTTSHTLSWHSIPGIHGIGILVEKEELTNNKDLAALLKEFTINAVLKNHIETMERDRIDTVVRLQGIEQELENTTIKMKEAQEEAFFLHEKFQHQKVVNFTLRKELRTAKQQVEDHENLLEQRNLLLRSISWRTTAPLRYIESKRRSLLRYLRRR
jgi:hypothetical protein